MSNYPPPPPGSFPPLSPQATPAYTMEPARASNASAVVSLVCGLVFCVPFLTSLLAVIFGMVGLSKSKGPRGSGRGMAMAGLILGVLGLAGWSVASYGMYWGISAIKAYIVPATGLMESLVQGDTVKARQFVTPDVTNKDLEQASATIRSLGNFVRLDNPNFQQTTANGVTTSTLTGTAVFDKGSKNLTVSLVKDAAGVVKISEFVLQELSHDKQ
jgi:hypothetical protein